MFRRQLFLGETLDVERIEAGYAAGVLTVKIPVAEEAQPRKIEISHAEEKEGTRRLTARRPGPWARPETAGPTGFRRPAGTPARVGIGAGMSLRRRW